MRLAYITQLPGYRQFLVENFGWLLWIMPKAYNLRHDRTGYVITMDSISRQMRHHPSLSICCWIHHARSWYRTTGYTRSNRTTGSRNAYFDRHIEWPTDSGCGHQLWQVPDGIRFDPWPCSERCCRRRTSRDRWDHISCAFASRLMHAVSHTCWRRSFS